ncbi:unnamed protein product [Strongylus vulgaris]|uniref:Uncharacterized protein n=1 Tax=Strongylus vulgaris TaxID=40348 RepID=A0A3P7M0X0_STRVU|nr:unnamed protein product [Strongylus vulgaris]
MPGYQGYPQQQYPAATAYQQQYLPNSSIPAPAPNQWQDASVSAQQAQYSNSIAHPAPITNGAAQPPSQIQQQQPQAYYAPMQQVSLAQYSQVTVPLTSSQPNAMPVAQSAAPMVLGSSSQPAQEQQYPPTQSTYQSNSMHIQNTVNGTEAPAAQQPEAVEQPLISFD